MKTIEEIYEELKSDFESASGITLHEGGDMSLRFMALAAQINSLYCEAEYVSDQSMPQTASGENLDRFAAIRGLIRIPAAAATGTLRFTAAGKVSVTVEAGTRCIGKNGCEYVTTETKTTDADTGTCDVAASAVKAGTEGNTAVGTVTEMMLPPNGIVSCRNTVKFSGGRDEESDAELRERVLNSYKSMINGGNAAYYKALALSCDGVGSVQVVPKNRGTGTVDVYIAAHGNIAPATLTEKVQALMDENREVCTDVLVKSGTKKQVRVSVTLEILSGYDSEKVINKVTLAIMNYFEKAVLGKKILRAELGSIVYSVEGVENYTIVYPAADVDVGDTELPALGQIEVKEATD